jgi:hypothetical protein
MRSSQKEFSTTVITDGAPIYPLAIQFFNLFAKQQGLKASFSHKVVPGLYGTEPERRFKNIIERFFSTFRFSYRLKRGLSSQNSCLAHFTIFAFYYNYFRPHLALDCQPPARMPKLNPQQNQIKIWAQIICLAFNSS